MSAASGTFLFLALSSQTVTATANPGYQFKNWTMDGSVVSTSASYTFTLAGNFSPVANFSRNRTSHDFNGDGYSDIAWRNSNGDFGIWLMNGTQILNNPDFGNVPNTWTVVGLRDFNGDGYADILWRDTAGDVGMWFMDGAQILQQPVIGNVPTSWTVVGTGDFNGDGKGDILWRNSNGDIGIWLMNGTQILQNPIIGNVPASWTIAGIGDFNGDGYSDILWRNSNGDIGIWFMNGTQILQQPVFSNVPTNWAIVGTGDFNGDGMSDILWRDTAGDVGIWLMNGTADLATIRCGQRSRHLGNRANRRLQRRRHVRHSLAQFRRRRRDLVYERNTDFATIRLHQHSNELDDTGRRGRLMQRQSERHFLGSITVAKSACG